MHKYLYALLLAAAAVATQAAPLQFQSAVVPEAPPGAEVMTAYFTIVNSDQRERIITSIMSPEFAEVQIHRTIIEDGVARMEPVQRLTVPPQSQVELQPGGMHLMLISPQQPYYADDLIVLKIQEADGTEHALAIAVQKLTGAAHAHHEH